MLFLLIFVSCDDNKITNVDNNTLSTNGGKKGNFIQSNGTLNSEDSLRVDTMLSVSIGYQMNESQVFGVDSVVIYLDSNGIYTISSYLDLDTNGKIRHTYQYWDYEAQGLANQERKKKYECLGVAGCTKNNCLLVLETRSCPCSSGGNDCTFNEENILQNHIDLYYGAGNTRLGVIGGYSELIKYDYYNQ